MLKEFLTRCWDRKCTCNPKKTRQVTQEDYERVNMGPQLSMEDKYSSMLVVVLLAMTYGSGLPIMYLLSMVYFFTCYWVDKFLIFYNHSKPLYFDE